MRDLARQVRRSQRLVVKPTGACADIMSKHALSDSFLTKQIRLHCHRFSKKTFCVLLTAQRKRLAERQKLCGGKGSDSSVTQNSGFLDYFPAGDEVKGGAVVLLSTLPNLVHEKGILGGGFPVFCLLEGHTFKGTLPNFVYWKDDMEGTILHFVH